MDDRNDKPVLTPPLKSFKVMRDLMTSYYIRAKTAKERNEKVAWITSGGPVEPLYAFGIIPVYPENHGAMCGASKMAVNLSEKAESAGFSQDICSYARCDIGSYLTGGGPIGGLPAPDILICCNNICGTVLKWYEEASRHFECPLFVFDTPFIRGELSDAGKNYVTEQMKELIMFLEEKTGQDFNESVFVEICMKSLDCIDKWSSILKTASHIPSPITCFDAFIHMAPVVTLRGTDEVLSYYDTLSSELDERINNGIGAVSPERLRLIWDNIPIWFEMRNLGNFLAQRGICLVADTYTTAWAFEGIDKTDPIKGLSEAYASIYLNKGLEQMYEDIVKLIGFYKGSGVVMHSNRSCKPYSIGQYDIASMIRNNVEVPVIIIEADHTDERHFARSQSYNRLEAFVESIFLQ